MFTSISIYGIQSLKWRAYQIWSGSAQNWKSFWDSFFNGPGRQCGLRADREPDEGRAWMSNYTQYKWLHTNTICDLIKTRQIIHFRAYILYKILYNSVYRALREHRWRGWQTYVRLKKTHLDAPYTPSGTNCWASIINMLEKNRPCH